MDYLDTKSIQSVEAKSITSHNSGGGASQSSQLQNVYTNSKDNVKVVIRIRPLNEREKGNGGSKKCVSIENKNTIIIEQKPDQKVFNFDFVGDEDLEQETVFNQIAKPIADCCLEGYNGTIFAYGQTGAGKTFTIQGPSIQVNGEDQMLVMGAKDQKDYQLVGLMPRSFDYIFECIDKSKQKVEQANDGSHFDYLIRCSYLEIYNEQIMDLLDPSSVNLHIREDLKKGVYVEGLIEENVQNAQEMVELISRGSRNRHVGSTSMNKESSRSHSVLTTIIETKSMKEGGGVWNIKTSRFHIIDLAGSERQKFTGAVGERLKEAGMINKSLSALGNVINSLVDISEGKNRHVHYRDSKLTFLLRDSLGGNSKTVIIANISPSCVNYGETLSTLKFAQRAKMIRNRAVINEDSNGTMNLMRNEINRLKKDLAESEKRAQSLGQQCAFCRNNIGNEQHPGCESYDEDEDLLSMSFHIQPDENNESKIGLETSVMLSGPQTEAVRQKFKSQKLDMFKLRERVIYLEGLLTANLDNLTSQQKFYEQETAKLQQQNKKLSQAVESYEKQCARDKMIIKFREDRITKLESQPQTPISPQQVDIEKQKVIADMKKEIAVWKEAADHNAQAAKLFAEKAQLNTQLEALKKELKQTPDSMSAQMRSLTELNEGLNDYLKKYCEESKKSVESEFAKAKLEYSEKIEKLTLAAEKMKKTEEQKQEKFEVEEKQWNELMVSYKSEMERVKLDHIKEREDLEKLNKEAVAQIKNEIQQISENKSEQEKEAQLFKIELIEKQSELEKELMKHQELIQDHLVKDTESKNHSAKLEHQLKAYEDSLKELSLQQMLQLDQSQSKLEEERKQFNQQLYEQSEIFEKKLFELEKQIMDDQNEREIIQEQSEQLSDRIKSLTEDNDRVQNIIMYKDEEINEFKEQLLERNNQIQNLTEKILEIQTNHSLNNDEKSVEIEKLTLIKEELLKEKEGLVSLLEQGKVDKEQLEQGIKEIKDELELLESQKLSLQEELKQNQDKIVELIQTHVQEKAQFDKNLIISQDQTQALQWSIKESQFDHNEQVKALISEKDTLQSQKEVLISEREKLSLANKAQIEKLELLYEQRNDITEQKELISKERDSLAQDNNQYLVSQERLEQQLDKLKKNLEILNKEKSTLLLEKQNLVDELALISTEKLAIQENHVSLTQEQQSIINDKLQVLEQKETKLAEIEQIAEEQVSQIKTQEQNITVLEQKLQTQEKASSQQLNELTSRLSEIQLQYQKELSALEEQTSQKVQKLEAELEQKTIIHNETLQVQAEKHSLEIISLETVKEQDLKHQEVLYEEKINTIAKEFEVQTIELQKTKQVEIEEIKQAVTEQVTLEQTNHQVEIENSQVEFKEIISELNGKIQSLETKLENAAEQFAQQIISNESSFKEFISKQENEQRQQLEQRVYIVIEEKNREQDELKAQLEQSLSQTQGDLQVQIQNLQQEKIQKVQELERIIQEKSAEVENSSQVAQKIIAESETKIQVLSEELKSVVQDLEKTIQEKNMGVENSKQVVQKVKAESESKIQVLSEELKNVVQKKAMELQSSEQIIQQQKLENEDKVLSLSENLKKVIQEKTMELQNQQQATLQLKSENDNKIKGLQQQVESYANHKQSLEDKLFQLSSQFENQLLQKDSTISQCQQQIQSLQSSQLSLQAQFEKQMNQHGEKQERLRAEWEKKEEQLVVAIKNQEQDMGILKDHTSKIVAEKSTLLSEISQLKGSDNSGKEKLQEAHQKINSLSKDIEMQKKLLDNTFEQLNNEHIRKYQEIEKEHSSSLIQLKNDSDQYKSHCKELAGQVQKLKDKNDEQKDVIKSSKEAINGMVQKENDLMIELEKKINELKEHQEGWRKRAHEVREEKDQMKKEWERTKKENDNLRELIKLKDRQIEEQLNVDEKDRETIDKIQKENKDLRNQLIKRDFEMKEIVKTIKLFQDEKNRLEKELDKLHRENDQLIGHKNPSQKIQHHLKIKEENNKLREENFKLMEELRRKTEMIANRNGGSKTPVGGKEMGSIVSNEDDLSNLSKDDFKKIKKENQTYQETINRLVDHILSQPGLMKILGLTEEMNEKIQQQSGTAKIKNAMEIISLFSSVLQQKEREVKEISREKKKIECRLDIVEKEKNLCKQQLEIVQSSSNSSSFVSQVGYLNKSPNTSYNRLVDNQNLYSVDSQHHLMPQFDTNQTHYNNNAPLNMNSTSQIRLHVDGFMSHDKQNVEMNNNNAFSKKSPSPLYNFKQQKEKENVQSKRDLFNTQQQQQQQQQQRSGSGRRAAYLSNVQKQ